MGFAERLNLKRNNSSLMTDVADGLIALRARQGWTRKELAALLFDVTEQHIQVWEKCARPPKGVHLLRVSRLLNLDLTQYPPDAIRASGVLQAVRIAKRDLRKALPVIDLASLIATARLLSGLPLDEFAERWQVSPKSIRNWEEGILPTGANAEKVAVNLGLPVTAIRLA